MANVFRMPLSLLPFLQMYTNGNKYWQDRIALQVQAERIGYAYKLSWLGEW